MHSACRILELPPAAAVVAVDIPLIGKAIARSGYAEGCPLTGRNVMVGWLRGDNNDGRCRECEAACAGATSSGCRKEQPVPEHATPALESGGQLCFMKPANYEAQRTKKFRSQIGRIESMHYDPQTAMQRGS